MNDQDILNQAQRIVTRAFKDQANQELANQIRSFLVEVLDNLDWMRAEILEHKLPSGQVVWTALLALESIVDVSVVCRDGDGEFFYCEWFPVD